MICKKITHGQGLCCHFKYISRKYICKCKLWEQCFLRENQDITGTYAAILAAPKDGSDVLLDSSIVALSEDL